MEKGRGRRWSGCGLCWAAAAAAAAAAAGRKGWKSSDGAGSVVGEAEAVIAVIGECGEPEDAGDDGSGVSVTLISGLGGHDDIRVAASAEVSFSELGGLAGSTISTVRLSKLIMAKMGLADFPPSYARDKDVRVCLLGDLLQLVLLMKIGSRRERESDRPTAQ